MREGRVTAVARGARGPKSRLKGLLQPFVPLLINWYGKSELVTLGGIDASGASITLVGDVLISGMYLNEVLMRLLTRFDPLPNLFEYYSQTILALSQKRAPEICLRMFELNLLNELGYGLQLSRAGGSNHCILANEYYFFQPNVGFLLQKDVSDDEKKKLFLGAHLLAIDERDFSQLEILPTAKRLLRKAISHLLAGKPILSRELFVPMNT